MTVKELITKLLDFDLDETVYINLEGEKDTDIESIETWHGIPIIHFNDWTKKENT